MEPSTDETRSLRRCVRELAALSVLSAAWGRTEPQGIADSLAEVLLRSLPHVDFIYARVKGLVDDVSLEAVHTPQVLERTTRSKDIGKALEPLLKSGNSGPPLVIPHPIGEGDVRLAVIPIGYEGDCGVLVAGCQQSDFPSQTDQLLLGVAANQAAVVLQHKRSEEALRRQSVLLHAERELLRVTLASIGDAVVTTDAQEQVRFLNPVAESLTGWTAADATGTALSQVFKIVNERTRQPVENPALRALTEGVIVGLANHTVLIAKDGTEHPIEDSAAPIRDLAGATVGVVLVFRDVTERRRHEEALRESEQRFRLMADSIPQVVWTAQTNGEVDFANRRWYDYTGLTPEQTMGSGWASALHPEDRERTAQRWQASLLSGEPVEIEYRLRAGDGKQRWQLVRGVPLKDSAGRVVKWFGTLTDIHDRKRADEDREKFVSLVENSTDFIGLCDTQGRAVYLNRAGMRLVGLAGWEEARRTSMRDYFFPDDQERVLNEFFPAVLRDGHGEIEVRFRHFRTRNALWMSYTVFTVADAGGKVIGLGTVSRDITERRQLEDNLRQLASDLSEADHRKDEFLATLAHELRNPLAPIRNGLHVLRLAGNNGQAVEQARTMMERQLGQMVRLVDDLLDVSRITRNKLELRRERVELAMVVASAVETSRPLIEASDHELTVTLPPSPIYLEADITRLAQVFSNLLNNAARYTERGGHIRLIAETKGKEVVVAVQDDGIGIRPDMLAKVFEMFTQADRTLERSQGGLGIGLTLVNRLVEMHGGAVQAHSEGQGHGSEFIVRLPVMEEGLGREEPHAQEEKAAVPKRRILVVDDNQDSVTSLGMMLSLMGNEICTAHDGLEAVEAAAAFRPDLILLDIGLPKLNGYEACRRIREQPWGKGVVIIACTGWGQEEDIRRSMEAGFDQHMVKPVDPAALEKFLSELQAAKA